MFCSPGQTLLPLRNARLALRALGIIAAEAALREIENEHL